jgi:hypothetical protein
MQYFLPLIMNTPNLADLPYNILFSLRFSLDTRSIPDDVIKMMVPEKPEEVEASQQLLLLNRNIELEPITDMSEDHDAYIAMYKQALDTPAKTKAIEARRMAKIEKKKILANQQSEQQ